MHTRKHQSKEARVFTQAFISQRGANRHHIDSFNYFVEKEMENVLRANSYIDSDIDPSFFLRYTSIRVAPPSIEENMVKRAVTVQECRLRNLTYAGDILVDIEYSRGKEVVVSRNVVIGRLPIMVCSALSIRSRKPQQGKSLSQRLFEALKGSRTKLVKIQSPAYSRPPEECPHDFGGYFICKGVERVLLMQEQLAKNRILVEHDFRGDLCAAVTSSSLERKSKTKIVLKKGQLYLAHNSLSEDIPLYIAMKGMGVTTDLEVEALVGTHIPISIRIRTQLEALVWIGSKIKTRSGGVKEARIFLCDILLAHVPGTGTDMRRKAEYLGVMARMLLEENEAQKNPAHARRDKTENDKDFVGNKRIELVGQMLSLLFEDLLKKLNAEMKKALDRVLCKRARAQELDALHFLVMSRNIVTTGFLRAISTGTWALKRFRMERSGITQVLSRLSRLSAIGMCARVSSQFEKTRKISGPRALHCSQWGVFCPADTPEGEACGLVKSLATLAEVSTAEDPAPVLEALAYLGVEDYALLGLAAVNMCKCWVNGVVAGVCRDLESTAKVLRQMRRKGKLPAGVSIWTAKDLHISTEAGRLCRPLVVIEQEIPRLCGTHLAQLRDGYRTVHDFLSEGRIEYLDQNESRNALIATWKDEVTNATTHLEIDPSAILGYVAGVIPFPHHNQSPRNTYQCAMGKQGVGTTGLDIRKRMDGLNFFLCSTQRPLAGTGAMDLIGYRDLPAGQNLTIAVMSMTGYDIEDAIVMNKASIDRGVGRALVYKTHALSLRMYPGGGMDTVSDGGVPSPGQRVKEGVTFIDRVAPSGARAGAIYRGIDPAVVEKTALIRTGDDLVTVKSLLREHRVPQVGDKFSSRHGQKGVIGLVLPQEDMPFNEAGISPDLIMNPHGFPSRMTVGKVLELVTGKAIAAGSLGLDECTASAFEGVSAREIASELSSLGFSASGKELLTCGTSGKKIPVSVFFGPVFYQRLKHMVSDKMHARARGPRAVLTRQPTEGRCRDGGFRLGEMERDCLIGYGASEILIERLVISSDRFMVYVCNKCNLLASPTGCPACDESVVHKIQMPYACKLLFQELMSMRIAPRIILKE